MVISRRNFGNFFCVLYFALPYIWRHVLSTFGKIIYIFVLYMPSLIFLISQPGSQLGKSFHISFNIHIIQ